MKHILGLSVLALLILAMAVPPPTRASTPMPRTAWKTFESTTLHVALDYPPDWSVRTLPSGAVFRSPQGTTIVLGVVETGVLTPEEFQLENQLPNTRCTSSTNRHGIRVRICFDTVSFAYSADFVIRTAGGSPRLLSLATSKGGSVDVLRVMTESLRLTR